MSTQWWTSYFEDREGLTRSMLAAKAIEYAEGSDRMHNFNRALDASGGRYTNREGVMFGFMLKHWTSILDILDDNDKGTFTPLPLIREKFGDMINYLHLMEASITHHQYPEAYADALPDLPF